MTMKESGRGRSGRQPQLELSVSVNGEQGSVEAVNLARQIDVIGMDSGSFRIQVSLQ